MHIAQILILLVYLGIISVVCYSLISVARWANGRRSEKETYYKTEALKKIAETQGAGGVAALEFLREEEKSANRRRREGQKLAGVVTVSVGIGLMVFIGLVDRKDTAPVYLVGIVPLSIGAALLLYAYVLGPKE